LARIPFRRIPLRARLALAFAAGMAVVLAGVAAFVYVQLRGDLLYAVDTGLQSRAQVIIANAHRTGPALGGHTRHLIDADEAFAQVLTSTGRIVEATPAVAARPLVDAQVLRGAVRPKFVDRRPRGLDPARLLVVPTTVRGRPAFVIVGGTLSDAREALGRVLRLFAIAFPAALAICSLIGWILAGAALRPVERMRREAEAISATDIDRRLPVPATDGTLARLAVTLNRTFDRLQAAIERERRFVDDASHELRTPLTVLKAEIDAALAGDRTRTTLEHSLQSAAEEVDHLVRIAENMLVLARSQHGAIAIHRALEPLADILEQGRRSLSERAANAGVGIDVDAADALVCVDRTRIRQALDNLVDNAIRHSPPGGRIRIAGRVSAGTLSIAVADDGPGFEPGMLERAFDPFTRGAGATYDGSGLGLGIVSVIAAAHRGRVAVANTPDGGAVVTLEVACGAVDAASGEAAAEPPVAVSAPH